MINDNEVSGRLNTMKSLIYILSLLIRPYNHNCENSIVPMKNHPLVKVQFNILSSLKNPYDYTFENSSYLWRPYPSMKNQLVKHGI